VPSTNGARDRNGKTPLIGVYLRDRIVFPVRINIRAGEIGGPSAGLMFTLGIIQRLKNQDLTHGCKVAGTGTIDFDGTVGAIGGAKQKIIAARRIGAKYFFVPNVPENVDPAMAQRGDVTVLPVKTVRQALTYLRRIKPCR
jgi:PDZ domain-containing protein